MHVLALKWNRRRHEWRRGTCDPSRYVILLAWELTYRISSVALNIRRHALSFGKEAAIARESITAAQQVFRLLAWKIILLTGSGAIKTVCSGQEYRPPSHMAIMAYADMCIGRSSPIRQMLEETCAMDQQNLWSQLDLNQKRAIKVKALPEYAQKHNLDLLDFCFSTWQASWGMLFAT